MKAPVLLKDICGQIKIKERLQILIDCYKKDNKVLGHMLFDGPSGYGKTLFATAIANELNVEHQVINGSNLTSLKILYPILAKITHNSILFIDECHRISKKVQDALLVSLENFYYSLSSDRDTINIDLPPFCAIFSTTDFGFLNAAIRNRFAYQFSLESYNNSELVQIIQQHAAKNGLTLSNEDATILARASKGTPRICRHLVRWLGKYCLAKGVAPNSKSIYSCLSLAEISINGLDRNDKKYLATLKRLGCAGLNTLASATNISAITISETIEPYLIKQGLITKTSKGRELCV